MDRRQFVSRSGLFLTGSSLFSSYPFIGRRTPALGYSLPEHEGVDSEAIVHYLNAANQSGLEHHGFIMQRHGKIIAEAYWRPFTPDHLHTLYSLSKSFTSTAIGMAIDEGKIKLSDKLISFFPDLVPSSPSSNLQKLEIRHALHMATGHVVDTLPIMRSKDQSWIKTFFETPIEKEPGTHFLYNTGSTYMLSAIISKVMGMTAHEYLKPRLFDPLGITGTDWEKSPEGINTGGYGLRVSTRDISRFGQLWLQKGNWKTKQLISEAYVNDASTSHIKSNPGDGDWSQGYGYQFWRCKPGFYRGDGAFGQYCIIMPQYDAVIAVNSESSNMARQMQLMWEHLLPGIKDGPLKTNRAAKDHLRTLSDSLSLNSHIGLAADQINRIINGKVIKLGENKWDWESIKISSNGSEGDLTLVKKTETLKIPFGINSWKSNHQRINNPFTIDYRTQVPSMVAATAGATDPDMFKIRFKYTEAIHGDLMTLRVINPEKLEFSWMNSLSEKGANNVRETRMPVQGMI